MSDDHKWPLWKSCLFVVAVCAAFWTAGYFAIREAMRQPPGQIVSAGPAARDFCNRTPAECEITRPSVIPAPSRRRIEDIAFDVREGIRQKPESDGADFWQIATTYGDCEDIALATIQALVRAGYPRGALSVGVVLMWSLKQHAVVFINFSDGVWQIDLFYPHSEPWSESSYYLIRRQSWGNPTQWETGL